MKLIAAIVTSAISGLLALPLLAGGTTGRAIAGCGDVPRVLDTIRTLESGGDYTVKAAHASASGAYQIIDSTWAAWSAAAGVGTEYQHASQAAPAVQDAVAGYHVQMILDQYHDVSYVPVAWYYPAAITNTALMDIVPAPEAGNTLTPREYQTRWMGVYDSKAATGTVVCGPVLAGGEWSLPVDRSFIDANPAALSAPHHDYPAWDFGIPVGTTIFAIHAGIVDRVSNWSGNCYCITLLARFEHIAADFKLIVHSASSAVWICLRHGTTRSKRTHRSVAPLARHTHHEPSTAPQARQSSAESSAASAPTVPTNLLATNG